MISFFVVVKGLRRIFCDFFCIYNSTHLVFPSVNFGFVLSDFLSEFWFFFLTTLIIIIAKAVTECLVIVATIFVGSVWRISVVMVAIFAEDSEDTCWLYRLQEWMLT
jgi:hypothetical protein